MSSNRQLPTADSIREATRGELPNYSSLRAPSHSLLIVHCAAKRVTKAMAAAAGAGAGGGAAGGAGGGMGGGGKSVEERVGVVERRLGQLERDFWTHMRAEHASYLSTVRTRELYARLARYVLAPAALALLAWLLLRRARAALAS